MTNHQRFEEIEIGGRHVGCVCYSPKLNRWAVTWNSYPNEDDAETYIFTSYTQALEFLPVRYPPHGGALTMLEVRSILQERS